LQLRAEAFTDLSRNPVLDLSVRQMAMYERLKAKEAELGYNAAKGRILKKIARIKIVRNRSAPYEIEKGKPQRRTYEAFKYAPLDDEASNIRSYLIAMLGRRGYGSLLFRRTAGRAAAS
jgi:hypothetical protein